MEKAIKKNNTLETIQTLKEKEKSLQTQIKKLLDISLNEIISEDEYTRKRAKLNKKLAEVNKKIIKNATISKAEERIHNRVSNMKQNLKLNKEIIEYFDEDAYKCLIKSNCGRK